MKVTKANYEKKQFVKWIDKKYVVGILYKPTKDRICLSISGPGKIPKKWLIKTLDAMKVENACPRWWPERTKRSHVKVKDPEVFLLVYNYGFGAVYRELGFHGVIGSKNLVNAILEGAKSLARKGNLAPGTSISLPSDLKKWKQRHPWVKK